MRSLYFPVSAPAPAFVIEACRVISVGPLLRELFLRVAELGAIDSREPTEARVMGVLMDELTTARIEPLLLPLPADERALTAANRGLASPADSATTEGLARRSGLSARTLERLFRAETGMSFGLCDRKRACSN